MGPVISKSRGITCRRLNNNWMKQCKYNFGLNTRKKFQPSLLLSVSWLWFSSEMMKFHFLIIQNKAMLQWRAYRGSGDFFLYLSLPPRRTGMFLWGVSCKWDIYSFLIGWRTRRLLADVMTEEKSHFCNVVTGVNAYSPCPGGGILSFFHLDSC